MSRKMLLVLVIACSLSSPVHASEAESPSWIRDAWTAFVGWVIASPTDPLVSPNSGMCIDPNGGGQYPPPCKDNSNP